MTDPRDQLKFLQKVCLYGERANKTDLSTQNQRQVKPVKTQSYLISEQQEYIEQG